MTKSNKKIVILIVVVIILLILFFALKWYNKEKREAYPTFFKPRVEMSLVKIKRITQDITDMDMKLLIDNPLPIGIQLDSLRYKIYIGGVEVIESTYPKTIHLEANDSSYISFPVIMKNKQLQEILKKLENQNIDSTEYKITGSTNISFLTFKNKPYQFNLSKILPLYIVPKVKVEKIKIKKFGLKHSQIMLTIEIDNPNVFPYNFRETSYKIKIDNDHLVSGTIDSTINIPAKGKTIINLPADVSLSEAIETGVDSWFNSENTEYSLFLNTKIVADDNAIKNSQVILEAKGILKDFKE